MSLTSDENLSDLLQAKMERALQKIMQRNNREFFNMFCEKYEIPDPYPILMLDPSHAKGRLAMEIMVAKEIIVDVKSFEKFRPLVNKIQKKHFDGDILEIAIDILPIISEFLDFPAAHPEYVKRIDPLLMLEKVPLRFTRPKIN